jgi:signal transduction histidine kinase/CheY-like chemotaxis protein
MKKILVIVYSAVLVIILANFLYYKSLYNRQINYVYEILNRQVQIAGQTVDSVNNGFLTDLFEISLSDDLPKFFSVPENEYITKEKMRLFFLKYRDLVTGIKFYDNNRDGFTLKKDVESNEWLEQKFTLHVQPEIFDSLKLVQENRQFNFYLPVINKTDNSTFANLIVSIDYQKYFSLLFSVFYLKDFQWQWVINDSGDIVFSNNENQVKYVNLEKITGESTNKSMGKLIHKAVIKDVEQGIISSYYSTQLLQRNLRFVFSAPVNLFQKYIVRKSLLILIITLLLVQTIIWVFLRYIKSSKSELQRLNGTEEAFFRIIDEFPVGVIMHNKDRIIIRANRIAANQYSYTNESEMIGEAYPEIMTTDDSDFYTRTAEGIYDPSQFVKIKKEEGEIVLYRNSITDLFLGEQVTVEILIDVTKVQSALKQEEKANVAKSEFLARMSYEIRTPLNGIIGMADILNRFELSPQVRDIAKLLHRSTEVLLNIVNDILDFSKIESGRIILDEVPFSVRKEINYCVDVAKSTLMGHQLSIVCNIADNVPKKIVGDPFRFRQILTNLINHSIRNTEKGQIRLNCLLESINNSIVTLRFDLLDTGKSFDKISLKKIFGDFVTYDPRTAIAKEEPGFATILTKQLIELMGGELSAVSPSGLSDQMGTKVTFTLLGYSGDRPPKKLAFEEIRSYDQVKTLVITGTQNRDEEILGSLHKMGLNVSTTTYMKSTVNQIRENLNFPTDRYNLIVIVNDDDFNGFEAANEIWENNLSDNFIIVMISSHDEKGNYIRCLSIGVDHYLVKPFDVSELLKSIMNSFPFIEDKVASAVKGRPKSEINILIVEDNKMNQKVMGTMLENLGYNYELADDGSKGYQKALNKVFDLILMDLIMPVMDGYESAQKILEFDKSALIIAFSADNSHEAKRKSELAGMKSFISKPVRINELKKLLEMYL